jgi:hypothetical protein
LLQEHVAVDDSSQIRSGQGGTTTSSNDIAPASSETIGESARTHADGDLWVTLNDEVFALQPASQSNEADQQYRSVK